MNIFDEIIEIESNGKLFKLSAFRRYDPITIALIATGVGTGISVLGTLKEGKQAEEIGKARAAIDVQNAEAVREASVEKARIEGERGRRLRATQKGAAAASGIKINVGSPLVIESETRANIAKDIGFGLEAGRVESAALLSSAAIERATGKAKRKKSKFGALAQGLLGVGTIAGFGARLPGSPPGAGSPTQTGFPSVPGGGQFA